MEPTRREAVLSAVSSVGTATVHEDHWEALMPTFVALVLVFYFLQLQLCLNGSLLSTTTAITFLYPLPAQKAESILSQTDNQQRYHLIHSVCSARWDPETRKAVI